MTRLPVFQMKLGLDKASRPGWLLADEGEDEAGSFSFTIPLTVGQPFDQIELSLAGERDGHFEELILAFSGSVFVEPASKVRFALHDPFAPTDFRGLPFANAFGYIGEHGQTLGLYGLSPSTQFLSLAPIDLHRMDQLYLEQKLIFAGTTVAFGLHQQAGFVARPPNRSFLISVSDLPKLPNAPDIVLGGAVPPLPRLDFVVMNPVSPKTKQG